MQQEGDTRHTNPSLLPAPLQNSAKCLPSITPSQLTWIFKLLSSTLTNAIQY